MKEPEYKLLLDRQKYKTDAQLYYSKQISLLEDLASYGSNLIPRAIDSSKKATPDFIVLGVLLTHVVSMIDAVEVLLSNGAAYAAFLPARSAFEASLYIDWILKDGTEKKARFYYIANLVEQMEWARRSKKGTNENQKLLEIFDSISKELEPDFFDKLDSLAIKTLPVIEEQLAKNPWHEYYEQYKAAKGRHWYQRLGASSLKVIAADVGRLPEYELYYVNASKVTHASSYGDHIKVKGHKITVMPIRHLETANFIVRFSTQSAFSTYKTILRRYRKGEESTLDIKYMRDWRGAFLNVPNVKYNFVDSENTKDSR